jgi:hypothetical protein
MEFDQPVQLTEMKQVDSLLGNSSVLTAAGNVQNFRAMGLTLRPPLRHFLSPLDYPVRKCLVII